MEIKITKNPNKGTLPPSDKLGFGHYFTDHMFVMDYSDAEGWHDARIVPYGPISLSPAASVFHYGTEVFEGLKAYRTPRRRRAAVPSLGQRGPPEHAPATVWACPASTRDDGTRRRIRAVGQARSATGFLPIPVRRLYIRPFLFSTDPDAGAARRA